MKIRCTRAIYHSAQKNSADKIRLRCLDDSYFPRNPFTASESAGREEYLGRVFRQSV